MDLFKYLLVLASAFLLTGLSNTSPETDEDLILWGSKKLDWTDFKGLPDSNLDYKANTRTQLRTPCTWTNDSLYCKIYVEFDCNLSWVKSNPSNNLLKHEQGHFDLGEYIARKFRKELTQTKFQSRENIGQEITEIFNRYLVEWEDLQDVYDAETDHSRNRKEQLIWNEKIQNYLDEFQEYKNSDIALSLSYL